MFVCGTIIDPWGTPLNIGNSISIGLYSLLQQHLKMLSLNIYLFFKPQSSTFPHPSFCTLDFQKHMRIRDCRLGWLQWFRSVSCGAPPDPECVIYIFRIIQRSKDVQGHNPLIYSTRLVLGLSTAATLRPFGERRAAQCTMPNHVTSEQLLQRNTATVRFVQQLSSTSDRQNYGLPDVNIGRWLGTAWSSLAT